MGVLIDFYFSPLKLFFKKIPFFFSLLDRFSGSATCLGRRKCWIIRQKSWREEGWAGGTCGEREKWEKDGKKEGKPDKPSQAIPALSRFPGFSLTTLPAYPSASSSPGMNIPVPEGGIPEG